MPTQGGGIFDIDYYDTAGCIEIYARHLSTKRGRFHTSDTLLRLIYTGEHDYYTMHFLFTANEAWLARRPACTPRAYHDIFALATDHRVSFRAFALFLVWRALLLATASTALAFTRVSSEVDTLVILLGILSSYAERRQYFADSIYHDATRLSPCSCHCFRILRRFNDCLIYRFAGPRLSASLWWFTWASPFCRWGTRGDEDMRHFRFKSDWLVLF